MNKEIERLANELQEECRENNINLLLIADDKTNVKTYANGPSDELIRCHFQLGGELYKEVYPNV